MTLSICIFAHNEERLLPRTVGALENAAAGAPYSAHIMVNGATDATLFVARALAAANGNITVHELSLGDKANAWNDYVYRIASSSENAISTHIFLDGDIKPSDGAFAVLGEALQQTPQTYGAAAFPITGRSRRGWSERLLEHNYLSGNLYALSEKALIRMRDEKIRLPLGLKGEDGLITYLLLTDLKGGRDDTHRERITPCPEATFEFSSLGASVYDLQLYHHRLRRYSERHFQNQILYRRLKEDGVRALPERIAEIYDASALAPLRARRDIIHYWYDRATLKRLSHGDFRSVAKPL